MDDSDAEDNTKVFEAEGGSSDDTSGEEPPAGEEDAEEPFNPVPLSELVQAPNKEDLFGEFTAACPQSVGSLL